MDTYHTLLPGQADVDLQSPNTPIKVTLRRATSKSAVTYGFEFDLLC